MKRLELFAGVLATAIGMISNELGLPLRQIASNSYERDLTVCRAQEQYILLARCLDELGVKARVPSMYGLIAKVDYIIPTNVR